jgi:hypothetical protein
VIPLIAVAAVALCVALVIVVVSVMTGFLNMVKNSGRTLIGDVVISYPVSGVPYYEKLIQRIDQLPEAAAATPVVDGLGILKMPYPDRPDKRSEGVQFWGIDPESFAAVTGYENTLHWKTVPENEWSFLLQDVISKYWKDIRDALSADQKVAFLKKFFSEPDPTSAPSEQAIRDTLSNISDESWEQLLTAPESLRREPDLLKSVLTDSQWHDLLAHDERLLDPSAILKQGMTLDQQGDNRTIVLGMHVSEANQRQRDGSYRAMGGGRWWMPRFQVTLTTLPVAGGVGGADTAESRVLQVVNEFMSGVYLIDDKRVMIPLSVAQDMLHLSEATKVDEAGNEIGKAPACATMVLVRAKPGVTPEKLRDAVEAA